MISLQTLCLYVARYWKPEIFLAINLLRNISQEEGVSITSISLRWLIHHSKLIGGDGLVFSASSLEQCEEDLACAKEGALNERILTVIERIGDIVRPVEAQYFRGYDKVHGRADRWLKQFPNREYI